MVFVTVCDFCDDTVTFSTKTCGDTFKIQSGFLNCNSQKVVYLLKCRLCGEAPHVGKAKTRFRARFNDYKSVHMSYKKNRKVSQQRFHEYYGQHSHNGIDDWQFNLSFVFSFSWVTTTLRVLKPVLCFHMISFNYGAKGVRDVDPACRCHQRNIMPDSIFSINITRCVTCLVVFYFVFFYMCIKE